MVIKVFLFVVLLLIPYIIFKDEIRTKYKLEKIFSYPEFVFVKKDGEIIDEFIIKENIENYVSKETIIIKSKYTKENIPFDIILPKGIKDFEVKRALILLHGIRDTKDCWIEKGRLLENYIQLLEEGKIGRIAFILPSSGYNGESWYTNFYQLEEFRYEDFFSKELLPLIKNRFNNSKLGIIGFSMGGYGAYKLGLKNLSYFEVIGSMAGAISLIRLILKRRVLKIFRYMYIPKFLFNKFDQRHFIRVFGSQGLDIIKEDPYTMLKELKYEEIKDKKFFASVGTLDNEPYRMYSQWVDCIGRMKKFNYKFKAYLYEGEAHTWDYVARDLKNFLKYFSDNTK
ncbi:MAG: alpha/beta hydrolase [Fusobacteriaceae bacterium]